MHDLKSVVVARIADRPFSAHDFHRALKHKQRLKPLLLEVAVEQLLLDLARQAGLAVSSEELQKAADSFRQRNGLNSADRTRDWLAEQHMSDLDLEDVLEQDLLIGKLKDHVTGDGIQAHFAARQEDYAVARLRLIHLAGEDASREVALQISEEGVDFGEMARKYSLDASRATGGSLGRILRRQLPENISAAIFAAAPGSVIGPLAANDGFQIFLVESLETAELDVERTAIIRQELFESWFATQLSAHKLEILLEAF